MVRIRFIDVPNRPDRVVKLSEGVSLVHGNACKKAEQLTGVLIMVFLKITLQVR